MDTLHVRTVPLLAVLADDYKKSELIELLRPCCGDLDVVRLVATRDTGNLIRSRLGLDVELVEAGARGGAFQIAALVVEGVVDGVIALHQTGLTLGDDAGMLAVRRMCEIHDVACATNAATARAVLSSLVGCDVSRRVCVVKG